MILLGIFHKYLLMLTQLKSNVNAEDQNLLNIAPPKPSLKQLLLGGMSWEMDPNLSECYLEDYKRQSNFETSKMHL